MKDEGGRMRGEAKAPWETGELALRTGDRYYYKWGVRYACASVWPVNGPGGAFESRRSRSWPIRRKASRALADGNTETLIGANLR